DDARMVQLVGEDQIALAQERRYGARVRREAALEDNRGLRLLEDGDPPLQLHVEFHRPGDGANRARTHAERLHGGQGGLAHPGMGGEAEVVVGGEIHNFAAVEPRHRELLALKLPERAVEAVPRQLRERLVQILERALRGWRRAHGWSR